MKGLYDDLFFNSLLVCWGRRGQNIQEIVHGYPIPVIVHGYPWLPNDGFYGFVLCRKKMCRKICFFKYMYIIADK